MYFICYEHPDYGSVYETIYGEDTMQIRVHNLMNELDLEDDDIHVFNADDEV